MNLPIASQHQLKIPISVSIFSRPDALPSGSFQAAKNTRRIGIKISNAIRK
ncbi:hypothetical protein [Burkholderia thailandensis]|uniref:hypothetical protein n=1 Tax=Burkholderia thailandensis TaxID=57975 RepID=UPI00165239A9|nr:hypothetical protein [Burkholderia thailandensis]